MALARNTDPHTSHEAAFEHEASGRAMSNRAAVQRLVEHLPGHTSRELSEHQLAECLGLTRHEIARRLPELRAMGRVVMGDARRCLCAGRAAVTWYPA